MVFLFARIWHLFWLLKLKSHTEMKPTNKMKKILVGIMIELHAILGFVTNEIRQGRASEWMKSCPILLLIEIQRDLSEGEIL